MEVNGRPWQIIIFALLFAITEKKNHDRISMTFHKRKKNTLERLITAVTREKEVTFTFTNVVDFYYLQQHFYFICLFYGIHCQGKIMQNILLKILFDQKIQYI